MDRHEIIRKYKWNLASIVIGSTLLVAQGWQMEIVAILAWNHNLCFDFPFYIGRCINLWIARDFWEAIKYIGALLIGIGLWYWE